MDADPEASSGYRTYRHTKPHTVQQRLVVPGIVAANSITSGSRQGFSATTNQDHQQPAQPGRLCPYCRWTGTEAERDGHFRDMHRLDLEAPANDRVDSNISCHTTTAAQNVPGTTVKQVTSKTGTKIAQSFAPQTSCGPGTAQAPLQVARDSSDANRLVDTHAITVPSGHHAYARLDVNPSYQPRSGLDNAAWPVAKGAPRVQGYTRFHPYGPRGPYPTPPSRETVPMAPILCYLVLPHELASMRGAYRAATSPFHSGAMQPLDAGTRTWGAPVTIDSLQRAAGMRGNDTQGGPLRDLEYANRYNLGTPDSQLQLDTAHGFLGQREGVESTLTIEHSHTQDIEGSQMQDNRVGKPSDSWGHNDESVDQGKPDQLPDANDSAIMKAENPSEPCPICERKFSRRPDLVRHMLTHIDDGSCPMFECTVEGCGYKTRQKSNLKSHTKVRHTKEKPYICPICPDWRTSHASALTRHRKSEHGYEPPKRKRREKAPVCDVVVPL